MSEDGAHSLDDLAQEYVQRLRDGEDATPESYAQEHPELAGRIRELFPVLALMEDLKRPPAAPSAPAETSAPQAEATPERIGSYDIVRELGRGGMGRVYEVRDEAGRRHALKIVHPHLLERPGFLARFLREIDTGLRIEHPGLIRTLESGVAEVEGVEVPYVLLEFVEGETLRDLLEETGAVSERLAREIGIAIAEALAAVHQVGVVHRDVKPENVILAPDESIKLMDLGVALVAEEALRLTQTGEFVGSLLYAAPEQLRRRQVDARADLYALGLLLYELVSGRHPQAIEGRSLLQEKLDTRRVPRLRDAAPTATAFFERVVERMLEPEPNERLGDAAAVARILREGESGDWWTETRHESGSRARPRRFLGAVDVAGRDAEYALLDEAWAEAREGRGQVRILGGEAGIGKSRLVSSWLDRLELEAPATAVLWMEYTPDAGVLGLYPVASALLRLLGEEPEARVRAWLEDLADRTDDVLASLRNAERGHVGVGPLEGAVLETMVVLLLRGLAREQPIVIGVEDLHFATQEGRNLFERLAHAFVDDRVLLLGTVRPMDPPLFEEMVAHLAHVSTVDIGALDEDAALEVLRAGLGAVPQSIDAVRALVRMSDGNPYCLLEFARDVRSRADAPQALDAEVVLPRSVRKLVEARLHALGADDRHLLGLAACCGYRFDPVVVCEAGELPRLGGLRALHRLDRERGLIVADGMDYRFHHHLVQEVLYDELPPALRAAYHTALGAACETRLPEGQATTGAEAFAVAHHFLHGDEPARAEPFVIAGLDYLITLSEGRRATRMARAALEALPRASKALRARMLFYLGRAMDGNAPPTEILAVLEKALTAARETDDRGLELDALQHMGAAVSHTGRHADAAKISARAVALAEQIDDPVRLSRSLTSHATSLYNMGDPAAAFAAGRRALDLARSAGEALQAGQTATVLSALYLEAGGIDEARPMAELALSITHLHGDRGAEQFVSSVLAKMTLLQGDLNGALLMTERGQALARELGNLRVAMAAEIGMAQVQFNLGSPAEAIERADEALTVCDSMGYVEISALLSIPRALAASVLGDLGEAWASASTGRELLSKVPLPAIQARVLPIVAQTLTWMGGFDEAEEVLARGITAAEEAGVPRERVQLRQVAAGLLDAQGKLREAAAGYAEVLEEVRERKMGLYVALVSQRLGGLHVRLGEAEAARICLDEATALATVGGHPSVPAVCGVWLDLLPGGNLQRARIVLERDAHVLPARARLRLWLELAGRTGDDGDRDNARALCDQLIASAPAAWRDRMRTDVALYRDALA